MTRRVVVIIPARGRADLTRRIVHAVLCDYSEADILVVDSKGDYRPTGLEQIVAVGTPQTWAKACNIGIESALDLFGLESPLMLLNNDVSISTGFVIGMLSAQEEMSARLVGPYYDDSWEIQRGYYLGPAKGYVPRAREHLVPFIDGTCMLISADTVTRVGLLDTNLFGQYGWGADFDYALRVRDGGGIVVATERAYLNHEGHGTAQLLPPGWKEAAKSELLVGMSTKWGADWKTRLGIGVVVNDPWPFDDMQVQPHQNRDA